MPIEDSKNEKISATLRSEPKGVVASKANSNFTKKSANETIARGKASNKSGGSAQPNPKGVHTQPSSKGQPEKKKIRGFSLEQLDFIKQMKFKLTDKFVDSFQKHDLDYKLNILLNPYSRIQLYSLLKNNFLINALFIQNFKNFDQFNNDFHLNLNLLPTTLGDYYNSLKISLLKEEINYNLLILYFINDILNFVSSRSVRQEAALKGFNPLTHPANPTRVIRSASTPHLSLCRDAERKYATNASKGASGVSVGKEGPLSDQYGRQHPQYTIKSLSRTVWRYQKNVRNSLAIKFGFNFNLGSISIVEASKKINELLKSSFDISKRYKAENFIIQNTVLRTVLTHPSRFDHKRLLSRGKLIASLAKKTGPI